MIAGTIKQFNFSDFLENGNFQEISSNGQNSYSTIGITYDEKDPYFLNISTAKYKLLTFVIITGDAVTSTVASTVSIGRTDMYEITQPMLIRSISFPDGCPQSIQVNVCSYSKEEE